MERYNTRNEAVQALDQGVSSGQFKNCAHLGYTLSGGGFRAIQYYYPVCEQDSFINPEPWNAQQFGCPKDCRLFVDRNVALTASMTVQESQKRAQARRRFWRGLGSILAAPFVYFQKLPALVQSLLIILLIVWKLPKFKDTIIEILKAINGK